MDGLCAYPWCTAATTITAFWPSMGGPLGAIATDASRGILGGVTGMTSERVAKQAALDDCKAKGGVTCKFDTSYVNGCTAVIASDTNYFVGLDPSLKKTVLDGLQTCNDKGRKKRSTLYSACSPPVRVH